MPPSSASAAGRPSTRRSISLAPRAQAPPVPDFAFGRCHVRAARRRAREPDRTLCRLGHSGMRLFRLRHSGIRTEAHQPRGIGDVFCFFTGVWDWQYANRTGKCEARWPYDEGLAAHSLKLAEAALARKAGHPRPDARGHQPHRRSFKWGGASYHGAGWCPRHIEGVEHFIFYAFEARTGIKFLHGQAVCLGLIAGAMMHGQRAEELRQAVADIGVDIRPQSMGLTWDDVDVTLLGLKDFVQAQWTTYGIAHDFEIDGRSWTGSGFSSASTRLRHAQSRRRSSPPPS